MDKKYERFDLRIEYKNFVGDKPIDVEDYNKFLHDFAKADTGMWGHPVTRTRIGEYKIEGKNQDKSLQANETYGTSRISSYHIFENLLNQRDVVIRDRKELDGKVYYDVNAKETQLAKEKARQMKEGFKEWIWKDINRREKYVEKYNNLFNAIRGREYDGSHQTFPGMNPAIKSIGPKGFIITMPIASGFMYLRYFFPQFSLFSIILTPLRCSKINAELNNEKPLV